MKSLKTFLFVPYTIYSHIIYGKAGNKGHGSFDKVMRGGAIIFVAVITVIAVVRAFEYGILA